MGFQVTCCNGIVTKINITDHSILNVQDLNLFLVE